MNKSAILGMVMAGVFSANAYAEKNDSGRGVAYQQGGYLSQDSTSGTNFNNSAVSVSSQAYSCGIQPTSTTQACGGNYNSGYISTTTYTTCNPSTGAKQQNKTSYSTCACNVPSPIAIPRSCGPNYNSGSIIYRRNYFCSGGGTTFADAVVANTCACNVPAPTTIVGQCSSGYQGSITYRRSYFCSGGGTAFTDTVVANTCTKINSSGCGGGGDKWNFMDQCSYNQKNKDDASRYTPTKGGR